MYQLVQMHYMRMQQLHSRIIVVINAGNAHSPALMTTIMRHSFMARHECECRETSSRDMNANDNDNAVMI